MKIGKIKVTFNWILFLIFALLFTTIAFYANSVGSEFLSSFYILDIMLKSIIEIGLIALPTTLIIITGGIDLSIGSTLLLSAIIGGLVAKTYGSTLGVIAAFATGIACGLFNGILIAKLKIPALVTTLATMFLFLGLAHMVTNGDSVYSFAASDKLGSYDLFNVFPLQNLIYIFAAVIFFIILSKSTLGRKLFGIGLNENATKYSGINTSKTLIIIYALSGFVCALAGLIYLGHYSSVTYTADSSLNLKAITIVVLGGTSILGGIGDIKSTVLATLIIAVLNSGLTVLNIQIDTQIMIYGLVLSISLIAYSIINRKAKSKLIIKPVVKPISAG